MMNTTGIAQWKIAVAVMLVALSAASAHAATVQGSISYAGMPVHTNFPTFTFAGVGAYNTGTGTWAFGTVDLATDSYVISGLAPGDYGIQARVSATEIGQDLLPKAGSLFGSAQVTIAGEGTVTQPLDLRYGVHLTQPLDNATAWVGSCSVCPKGAEVPKVFTLAWNAVPLATSYTVSVRRFSCAAQVGYDTQTTTSRSVEITQQTSTGEEYVQIEVAGFAGGSQLTVQPYVTMTGCLWQTHAFHAAATQTGRPTHPTNSRFIPQIAHLQGNPPSFWKADLFLTNPSWSAVRATLRFTPRDADGLVTYQEAEVDVPAQASRTTKDVLDTLFHTSGAGSLEIQPAALEAACRVYTPGAGPVSL